MTELKNSLRARDAAIWCIIEDTCAIFGPSLRSVLENFRVSFNISVSIAFSVMFI